jgi:hypothetical protein
LPVERSRTFHLARFKIWFEAYATHPLRVSVECQAEPQHPAIVEWCEHCPDPKFQWDC